MNNDFIEVNSMQGLLRRKAQYARYLDEYERLSKTIKSESG